MAIIAAGALVIIIVAASGALYLTSHVGTGNDAIKPTSCCTDSSLNLSTSCSTILSQNYQPLQRLELSIETDSSFVAAEDGHNYVANGGVGCGFAVNPGSYNGTTVDVHFTYTTNNQYADNCGYKENLTYFLTVKVPLTETGYDLSAIQVLPGSSPEITVTCTTSA